MLSKRTRKNRISKKQSGGNPRPNRRNRGGHGSGGRGGQGTGNRGGQGTGNSGGQGTGNSGGQGTGNSGGQGTGNRGRHGSGNRGGRNNRGGNNRTHNRPDNNRQSKGTKIKKKLLSVYKKINKAFEITKEQCKLYPYTKTLEPIEKFAAEMSRIKTEIKSINKAEGKCKNISH
jgi:hypothetical protein